MPHSPNLRFRCSKIRGTSRWHSPAWQRSITVSPHTRWLRSQPNLALPVTEPYHVTWSRDAVKNLKGFDHATRERIFRATEILSNHPRPPARKKLTGFTDLFRVKVGDYRIVYRVRDAELLIVVVSARHRRVAYRNLAN
ncbi:MAG: hypothetical protein F2525_00470 [Actinobacteria bacterium]|nr:hypothetical protein [Actinomycetota bacterium]